MSEYKIKYTFGNSIWKELELDNQNEYNTAIKVLSELSKYNYKFEYGEEKPEYLSSIEELEKYNLYFIALEAADAFLYYKCTSEYEKFLSKVRDNIYDPPSYSMIRFKKLEIFKILSYSDIDKLKYLFKNTRGFSRTARDWSRI